MHDSMVMAVCILPATSCTDYSVVTFFKNCFKCLSALGGGPLRQSARRPLSAAAAEPEGLGKSEYAQLLDGAHTDRTAQARHTPASGRAALAE